MRGHTLARASERRYSGGMKIRELFKSEQKRRFEQRQAFLDALTNEELDEYAGLTYGDGISVAGNARIKELEDLVDERIAAKKRPRHRKDPSDPRH